MGFFKSFGGGNEDSEIEVYLNDGAVVIDVRTIAEYEIGHVKGSENIVLQTLPAKVGKLKSLNKKIIAVCRTGSRSGQATLFLRQQGIDVINGGSWENVAKFVEKQ
jgi:rhodanese-related sulfurtransferase